MYRKKCEFSQILRKIYEFIQFLPNRLLRSCQTISCIKVGIITNFTTKYECPQILLQEVWVFSDLTNNNTFLLKICQKWMDVFFQIMSIEIRIFKSYDKRNSNFLNFPKISPNFVWFCSKKCKFCQILSKEIRFFADFTKWIMNLLRFFKKKSEFSQIFLNLIWIFLLQHYWLSLQTATEWSIVNNWWIYESNSVFTNANWIGGEDEQCIAQVFH